MTLLTFLLSDGKSFTMNESLFETSKKKINSLKNSKNEIVLPQADIRIMLKINKFIKYQQKKQINTSELSHKAFNTYTYFWTKELELSLNNQTNTFNLLLTAYILEIEELVRFCCRFIANSIKEMNPEKIAEIFRIRKEDFTLDQQKLALEELRLKEKSDSFIDIWKEK